MGDRRQRQNADRKRKQADKNIEKVTKEGDRTVEHAEKHLDRMRAGYAEGTKLYYDIYKTLATLTTGTILVIVALSKELLASSAAFTPLLWFAFLGLLVSMGAALMSMELITSGVFVALTRGADEIEGFAESTNRRLRRRTRISGWSFALSLYALVIFVILPLMLPLVGLWAYLPVPTLPLLVWLLLKRWL
ncbi:MAG: hypothetical protein M3Q49_04700 [Actinomycetota bacterium]|nr:hypothetical protein [Actinomycetota bacterium]